MQVAETSHNSHRCVKGDSVKTRLSKSFEDESADSTGLQVAKHVCFCEAQPGHASDSSTSASEPPAILPTENLSLHSSSHSLQEYTNSDGEEEVEKCASAVEAENVCCLNHISTSVNHSPAISVLVVQGREPIPSVFCDKV